MDRRSLALDRPFTYLLPEGSGAGVGSLVKVPFHGRPVDGWILGPTDDVPDRVLSVTKVVSPLRFFDGPMLELFRWMSERYVASLATVIARSYPPRVVSEESPLRRPPQAAPAPGRAEGRPPGPLASYRNAGLLLAAIRGGGGAFLHRPAPDEEASGAAEAVRECLRAGRQAVVLVPEQEPLPATAAAVLEEAGERGLLFAGGDRRERYRMWLRILSGEIDVVVGTRPAVFAPLGRLGLIWISRESHGGHREERSPSYHVRDVAIARTRICGGVAVASAFCPSAEAWALDIPHVVPARRAWPPVEVVAPGPEGRAPRLLGALRGTSGAFLFEPMRGYGVARVCKGCGEPAACGACGGTLRLERGRLACAVCNAEARCGSCGSVSFGIRRGGVERVEEWAARASDLPVQDAPVPPLRGRVTVGGMDAVKDFGPTGLDLVGILNADVVLRRPGLATAERALAVWMEAASWAGNRGRVVVQTEHPADAAIQSLVAGNPERFHRNERPRRERAGFPPGHPVFRVAGTAELPALLAGSELEHMLSTSNPDQTICLVTVDPGEVATFGRTLRSLAERGVVTRVEAEPHL